MRNNEWLMSPVFSQGKDGVVLLSSAELFCLQNN